MDWRVLESVLVKFIQSSRVPDDVHWNVEMQSNWCKMYYFSMSLVIDVENCMRGHWDRLKKFDWKIRKNEFKQNFTTQALDLRTKISEVGT